MGLRKPFASEYVTSGYRERGCRGFCKQLLNPRHCAKGAFWFASPASVQGTPKKRGTQLSGERLGKPGVLVFVLVALVASVGRAVSDTCCTDSVLSAVPGYTADTASPGGPRTLLLPVQLVVARGWQSGSRDLE